MEFVVFVIYVLFNFVIAIVARRRGRSGLAWFFVPWLISIPTALFFSLAFGPLFLLFLATPIFAVLFLFAMAPKGEKRKRERDKSINQLKRVFDAVEHDANKLEWSRR